MRWRGKMRRELRSSVPAPKGVLQLECLRSVRPVAQARVFDTVPGKAEVFAGRETARLGFPVSAAPTVEEALADADIAVAATWATEPFIEPCMVRPGTHITTLGPDQPGKAEVSADLVRQSRFIADDAGLALRMGAIGGVGLGAEAIAGTLGEVLAGAVRGRTSDDQITVFGAVGLPFQDLVAAWAAYNAARDAGWGRTIAFLD